MRRAALRKSTWLARVANAATPAGTAGEELNDIDPNDLTLASVPDRLERDGDPWAAIDDTPQSLEPLLALHERDRANGLHNARWPPVYPKQPDEPPRVAPSRTRRESRSILAVALRDAAKLAGAPLEATRPDPKG